MGMRKTHERSSSSSSSKGGLVPESVRFISSCLKSAASNVRSAGVSVAGTISGDSSSHNQLKEQVLWASFDKLELGPSSIKHVLLLGYSNGFQVLDVEDASSFSELVSKRDDPVTFLQMQPIPAQSDNTEGYKASHPLLLVVASDETRNSSSMQSGRDVVVRESSGDSQTGNHINNPTAVRFYSLRSHNYVHVLRFRSTVYMVRCSPRIVAVGLASQIYCFDSLTLESKFSVLTYPVPQLGGPGTSGVNIGYGPMAVGPRWLAYASNNPLSSNNGRVSPQCLTPSPGVSPSTSPGNGSVVARYAMESSKQLAAGLMNLGDKGYKTISKYYNDMRPDGSSSPVSSNSGWKVGRVGTQSTENDTAGMVAIRDFVSKAVISQFKAHTSPISALCFDPSGTLVVTASIQGNNMNVFRIMPSQSGSGTQGYDWMTSHVHLYKLHRGMTPAVIQDICFSPYSQWVAIVSSRGTCHVFVLSPFGGETGLHLHNSHVDGPSLTPVLCQPWWSTSSLTMSHQFFPSPPPPPPPPVTLSVVSRVRVGNTGWLNTVSNAASTAAGKVSLPSGVSAVFHSSIQPNMTPSPSTITPLEHLLVYSPSGNVIQYELLPSLGGEQGESALRMGTGSLVHMPEEELRVKSEPIQWWDVCRRVDWLEREECVYQVASGSNKNSAACGDRFDVVDGEIGEKDTVKTHDHSHWYLSNAEVQSSSGVIPIWQKSKISFFRLSLLGNEDQSTNKYRIGGEIQIEKLPVHEVEIKRKDLLPVFDHFHRIQPDWSDDRDGTGRRCSALSTSAHGEKEKFTGDVTNVYIGSARTSTALYDLHQMRPYPHISAIENDVLKEQDGTLSFSLLNQRSFHETDVLASNQQSTIGVSLIDESYAINTPPSLNPGSFSTGGTIAREVHSSSSPLNGAVSKTSSNRSDSSMNILDEGPEHEDMHDPLDFCEFFEEGYCKTSRCEKNNSAELTEVITDVDSTNSLCDKEKTEEDGDDDDMLGGVFAFSEEG